MRRTLVLDVVGLSPGLVGEHTPNLRAFARAGALRPLRTVTPAVTCSVQSTFLTGLLPSGHGAVANGWYFRELAEVWFWRQSNRLIESRIETRYQVKDRPCLCFEHFLRKFTISHEREPRDLSRWRRVP